MKLSEAKVLVFDLETTGLDPMQDKVVEVAGTIFNLSDPDKTQNIHYLCDPKMSIPPKASSIHHITDEMVRGADEFSLGMLPLQGIDVLCGHNIIEFDSKFLGDHGKPMLDTLRLAKKVWPDMESYSNQYLRYYHKLYLVDNIGSRAHDAMGDVIVTKTILMKLITDLKEMKKSSGGDPELVQLQDVIDWSMKPNLLKVCRFGKHKDKPWSEVPVDYLQWMMKNIQDMDTDTLFTVQHYLAK